MLKGFVFDTGAGFGVVHPNLRKKGLFLTITCFKIKINVLILKSNIFLKINDTKMKMVNFILCV